ncbi:15757_t:CDS:2, partial [Acaulospora morrowiae]
QFKMFEKFKKNCSKKWKRITASRITKLFIMFSVLQTIAIIILQIKVMMRNLEFMYFTFETTDGATTNYTKCEGLHGPQFPFIAYDNLIYIFFQIFLVYFCFNSIFHENTIQVLTISAVNFGWATYGIIQAIEIHVALRAVAALAACKGRSSFDSQPWKNDVPCVLVLFFFAFIMAYLSYKLYQSFGWNIYKKIGGDVKIQGDHENLRGVYGKAVTCDDNDDRKCKQTKTWLVLIYGIKILRKFGSGLKELLQKKSDKPFSGIRPIFISMNAQSTGLLEKNKRPIDEDEDD